MTSAAEEGAAASAAERVAVVRAAEGGGEAAAERGAISGIGSRAGRTIGKPGIGTAANIGLGIIASIAEAQVAQEAYNDRAAVLNGLLNQIAANGDADDEGWQLISDRLNEIKNMKQSTASALWGLISYG